jgi:alcohol-forming fatty acyl-CoA reductase
LSTHENLMQKNPRETLLAGAEYTDAYTDLQWCLRQPMGNWAIRTTGFVMRKAFRQGCSSITFDYPSFERAMQSLEPDTLVVLAPTHRSLMDFIVCSYLCFSHPELKISIPYIAADLQIGGLPFLGWFLKQTYAFYLKRGQGKPDPELNQKIRQLVLDQQTLEIFIEGTRSRARQCMSPKRGLLRALQNTGVPCALLPISINYDRLPEESALNRELQGGPKPLMRLGPLLKWCAQLVKGQVAIGRVHLVCGEPVLLNKESDVHAVSRAVMGQLQKNYVVTTFHLRAFLHHHPIPGYDLGTLTQAIQDRGGTVIESPFDQGSEVDQLTEYTFRNQWLHFFFPDLQAFAAEHPIVEHHIEANAFAPDQEPSERSDALLLRTLFAPLDHAYTKIIEVATAHEGLPFANARAFVAQYPECFLPWVEEALHHLTAAQVLVKTDDAKGFAWGPQWNHRADLYGACLWEQAPVLKAR